MLEEIKNALVNDPDAIKAILEHFDFHNVTLHHSYISFGRSEESSKKAIVINLKNNPWVFVNDYARGINKDIFSYIMNQRQVEFSEVLTEVKNALGVDEYEHLYKKRGIFGGFYERIKQHKRLSVPVYPDSVLNKYVDAPNLRFRRDGITFETQKYFGIRYDTDSQGIVIPIRTQFGELMGIKIRFNKDIQDGELKYFYDIPCSASQTLYGYSQNYSVLTNGDVYIFEAEKSVMQCHSYGIRNAVALGSGTISRKQTQMIYELNPRRIILMHDTGYDEESIKRNLKILKSYSRFSEIDIGYWDYDDLLYEDKVSASDLGKSELNRIINEEIRFIER